MPREYYHGFYDKGERTYNNLLFDAEHRTLTGEYLPDDRLRNKINFPFVGSALKPGKIVMPKGTIVAYCTNKNYQNDSRTRQMLPVITIANGGVDVTEDDKYGREYTRKANVPLGITLNNVYETINDTFYWGVPTIATDCHIRVPYFAGNTSQARTFDWVSCYGTLKHGQYVKSDDLGKFVPWVAGVDDPSQKVGMVTNIDRNIPKDTLRYLTLNIMDEIQRPLFNRVDMNPPMPFYPEGPYDEVNGTRSGYYNGGRKPYEYDPQGIPFELTGLDELYNPRHIGQLFGHPLHDSVDGYKETLTETFATGNPKYVFDGTSKTTIQLAHGLIQRDDEAVVNPSNAHPFASNLTVFVGSDQLIEGTDYVVLRNKGVVIMLNATGAETYEITYTHLENVIGGMPSSLNIAGVTGEIFIKVKTI